MSDRTTDAIDRAAAAARRAWGSNWIPQITSRAPGRLELLGNHLDYNGGPVLAAAIDRDAVCLARRTDHPGIVAILSDVSPEPITFDVAALHGWRNAGALPTSPDYLRGVIATALDRDNVVRDGVQLSIAGDVPIGFGLSSSAALCVALSMILHDPTPSGRELVLRAQEAEHRAGTPCGTMDQSASVGGKVILFDGANVTWEELGPTLGSFVFAVVDSGVTRSLATSSYPRRVEESQIALKRANEILVQDYATLARVTGPDVDVLSTVADDRLPSILKRRIRHVVSETARVREGADAMRTGDWNRFGRLMTESGRSSRGDYEISHSRVESIVDIAHKTHGVAGARMMGGGEGGVALVLLDRDAVSSLTATLSDTYFKEYRPKNPEPVRVFQFAPGASIDFAPAS